MDGMMIPLFKQPVCTAGQVSAILARPRPTITGWINRYSWLDIPGVVPGSTRMFSCADIGQLIALRCAISAGNMIEALQNSIDLIEPEIANEFHELMNQMQLDEWGASGTLRPRLPDLDFKLRLQTMQPLDRNVAPAAETLATGFLFPTRSKSSDSAYIADLAGYRVPELTIHFGQALRNGWTRTLWLLNGFALDD